MSWSFDIAAAPRGRTVTQNRTIKGKEVAVDVFERDPLILATKCGKVTLSHFIPKENRWCMLDAGEQPVAWMAWPDYPVEAR